MWTSRRSGTIAPPIIGVPCNTNCPVINPCGCALWGIPLSLPWKSNRRFWIWPVISTCGAIQKKQWLYWGNCPNGDSLSRHRVKWLPGALPVWPRVFKPEKVFAPVLRAAPREQAFQSCQCLLSGRPCGILGFGGAGAQVKEEPDKEQGEKNRPGTGSSDPRKIHTFPTLSHIMVPYE